MLSKYFCHVEYATKLAIVRYQMDAVNEDYRHHEMDIATLTKREAKILMKMNEIFREDEIQIIKNLATHLTREVEFHRGFTN